SCLMCLRVVDMSEGGTLVSAGMDRGTSPQGLLWSSQLTKHTHNTHTHTHITHRAPTHPTPIHTTTHTGIALPKVKHPLPFSSPSRILFLLPPLLLLCSLYL